LLTKLNDLLIYQLLLLPALFGYLIFIVFLLRGLAKLPFTGSAADVAPTLPAFTLLIPFYKEENNIAALIKSLEIALENGTAANYEVIFIDDHNSAESLEVVQKHFSRTGLNLRLLKNRKAPGKKNALAYGIKQARHSLILQTDADCTLEPWFFQNILSPFTNKEVQLCLGLVKMQPASSYWSRFAALDFLSLQASGLTLAAQGHAIMGNGAALAYRKEMVQKLNIPGKNWLSGDDVFLIQAQAKKNPFSVVAVPSAPASTAAPVTFKVLLQQRLRWGAKTVAYPSAKAQAVAALVAWVNMAAVAALAAPLVAGATKGLFLLIAFWLLKIGADYFLLSAFAKKSNQSALLGGYFVHALVYPFYLSFTVLYLLVAGKKAKWKGRSASPSLKP
jgi:cellulose synthase/poly-beta-1,6-N-acetylglucosamine synthase-like glycosyltransferase